MIWLLSIVILAADLFTKAYAASVWSESPLVLIKGALELTYVENRGAAWGMLKGARIAFIVLTVLFLVALLVFCFRFRSELNVFSRIIIVLLFSGAFGNLIDRIVFGYVRDMIYVSLIEFPVFNIADSAIVIGAILLAAQTFFRHDGIFDILENHAGKRKE